MTIQTCAALFEARGDQWNTPNYQGPTYYSKGPKAGLVRDPGYLQIHKNKPDRAVPKLDNFQDPPKIREPRDPLKEDWRLVMRMRERLARDPR